MFLCALQRNDKALTLKMVALTRYESHAITHLLALETAAQASSVLV